MMKDTVISELSLYPEVKENETAGAFAILQCKNGSDKAFLSFDHIKGQVSLDDYNYIDDYALTDECKKNGLYTILNKLYEAFNLDKPADFLGHSLSVSDIIALWTNKGVRFFFVDSIGFKEITA